MNSEQISSLTIALKILQETLVEGEMSIGLDNENETLLFFDTKEYLLGKVSKVASVKIAVLVNKSTEKDRYYCRGKE